MGTIGTPDPVCTAAIGIGKSKVMRIEPLAVPRLPGAIGETSICKAIFDKSMWKRCGESFVMPGTFFGLTGLPTADPDFTAIFAGCFRDASGCADFITFPFRVNQRCNLEKQEHLIRF
jgi:hypothetical protein